MDPRRAMSREGHFPFFNNPRAAEYRVHLNNLG